MTSLSNAMYAAVVGSDRSAVYTASTPPNVVNVSDASMVGSSLDIQNSRLINVQTITGYNTRVGGGVKHDIVHMRDQKNA